MDLIHMCINNDPQIRPHANEIIKRVNQIVTRFPASIANRLDMLRQIESDGEKKRSLSEEGERKDGIIKEKESQISSLREEVKAKEKQESAENLIDQVELAYSSKLEKLQLQVSDLSTQNQQMIAEYEAKVSELQSNAKDLEIQVTNKAKALLQVREQYKSQLTEEHEQHEIQLGKEREQSEKQLEKEKKQHDSDLENERRTCEMLLTKVRKQFATEREANTKLMAEIKTLQSDLSKSRSEKATLQNENSRLQSDITEKDITIQMKDDSAKTKDSKLEAKSRALKEKDVIISAMSEQLTKTIECLTTKKQVSTYVYLHNTPLIIVSVHHVCTQIDNLYNHYRKGW